MKQKPKNITFKLMVLFSIIFWINFGWVVYSNYQKENFEKTIDTQQKIVYNKNIEIKELTDDIEVKREEIDNLKNEVEKRKSEVSRGSSRYRTITVKTTSYTAEDGYTPGTTMANGQQVYVGAVAYNNSPLGTRIEIDGNMYTVCDRAVEDDVIDIYKPSYEEAINHGVQYKKVKIYE